MARGGYRPGAGRPKGSGKKAAKGDPAPADIAKPAKRAGLTPLDYMLAVMADPEADPIRRDRMAVAAAPFLHPRVAEKSKGKREQDAEKAEEVAAGSKFKARPAPLKLVAGG